VDAGTKHELVKAPLDAPISRSIEEFGRISAERIVGGLHHRYVRI
jgi:hypothetical protein